MDKSSLIVTPYGQPTEEELLEALSKLFSDKEILFPILDAIIEQHAHEQEYLNGLEEGEVTAAAKEMNYEQRALHMLANVFGGKNNHPYYLHAMQDAYDMLIEGARKAAAILKHAQKEHEEKIRRGEIPPDTVRKVGRPPKQPTLPLKAELGVSDPKKGKDKSKEKRDRDNAYRKAAHEGTLEHRKLSDRYWKRHSSADNAHSDLRRLAKHNKPKSTR